MPGHFGYIAKTGHHLPLREGASYLQYFDHHHKLGLIQEGNFGQVIVKDIRERTRGFTENKSCSIWVDGEWYSDGSLEGQIDLDKVEGYYSMVRYNSDKNTVELITDKWGMKPLYFFESQDIIIWSSEIKGIAMLLEDARELHMDAIHYFHQHGRYQGETTPFKKIQLIPPATQITIDISSHSITQNKYWELKEHLATSTDSFEEAVKKTTHLVISSFKRRYNTSEKNTIALSGGMDSRCLLSMTPVSKIQAFTFGEKDSDDMVLAKRVSKTTGTPHTSFVINEKNWLHDRLMSIWRTEGQQSFYEIHSAPIIALLPELGNVVLNGFGGATLMGGIFSGKDGRYPEAEYKGEFLDAHIILEHMRRGVQQGSLDVGRALVQRKPFFDTELILYLLSIPNEYRKGYKLFHSVLNNICDPKVLDVPWENTMVKFNNKLLTGLALIFKWPTIRRITGWMKPAFNYPAWSKGKSFSNWKEKWLFKNKLLQDTLNITESELRKIGLEQQGRFMATSIWLHQINQIEP